VPHHAEETPPPVDQISVLVVCPDDPAQSTLMQSLFQGRAALVAWERTLGQARSALAGMRFDVLVVAADLPDGDGLTLVADHANPRQCWATILLGAGLDDAEVERALQQGAFDVVDRADDPARLADAVARARSRRTVRPRAGRPAVPPAAVRRAASPEQQTLLLGDSKGMQLLRQRLERIAPAPVDALVTGETGCGKDLVARAIHALSGRRGSYVAVNCGAIPEALFESELFGHEAGAFTGAGKARIGLLEQSDGGTLFLDEIESMPLGQQVKLLRVLENRCIGRLGGHGERTLDLRIVAAAQRPLRDLCGRGLFRVDLWHRLNVVCLHVPPLRERVDDVALLFAHFADEACARFGVSPVPLRDAELARLMGHSWPGNVRELRHAAERHALGLPMWADDEPAQPAVPCLALQLSQVEREMIRTTLARHESDHHRTGSMLRAAATELGMSPKTLTRRMAALGLDHRQAGSVVDVTPAPSDARAGFVRDASPSDAHSSGRDSIRQHLKPDRGRTSSWR
jgi:two-component system C4-dicarboxylate transport response regulator DctD